MAGEIRGDDGNGDTEAIDDAEVDADDEDEARFKAVAEEEDGAATAESSVRRMTRIE
jgi:hypothetical protein